MTEPRENAKEADLERLKFEFEREKWHTELELRRRELELKETEERRRRGFFARIDPISVGIFTAALALMGTIATTWLQGELKRWSDASAHQQQRDLERERFEADLIKDYIKGSKPEFIENNLQFLVKVGLVVVKAPQLQSTLYTSSPPALTAGTRPALGDIEREACFLSNDWNRSEQACTTLLAARDLESNDEVLIRRRRGFILNELKQFDRAIAEYNNVIELDPKAESGWRNRALSRALTNDFHGAMADISESLRLAPQNARTLYVQGIFFELRDDPASAAQAFTAARTAVRDDAEWSQIEYDLSHYRPRR